MVICYQISELLESHDKVAHSESIIMNTSLEKELEPKANSELMELHSTALNFIHWYSLHNVEKCHFILSINGLVTKVSMARIFQGNSLKIVL